MPWTAIARWAPSPMSRNSLILLYCCFVPIRHLDWCYIRLILQILIFQIQNPKKRKLDCVLEPETAGTKVFSIPGGMVPVNPNLVEILDIIKPEAIELVEYANQVSSNIYYYYYYYNLCSLKVLKNGIIISYSSCFLTIFELQVKMWITFMIPKIEDGNNFGVSIQVWSLELPLPPAHEQLSRY